MNIMDVSCNFWSTSKWQPKYLESSYFKTSAWPSWFWALVSKALEKFLSSLHVLAVLGDFNSRFKHNNIRQSVSHRKPNVSSIASAYFAMLINLRTLLSFISFYLVVLFRNNIKTINLWATKGLFIYILSTYMSHVWLCLIRTKQSGCIEQNSGPEPNSFQTFSICHWNCNNISMHNFIHYLY